MYYKVISKVLEAIALAVTFSVLLSSCGSEITSTSAVKNQSTESVSSKTDTSTKKSTSSKKEANNKKDTNNKKYTNTFVNGKPRVKSNYFDDAVFIGDSVTVSFSLYVDKQREDGQDCLGKASVVAAPSLGYANAIYYPAGYEDSRLPIYKGEQRNIEDCVADLGAKKVYIMLGMNDVANPDMDETIQLANQLISNIKEKSPSVQIYLQSVTPMIRSMYRDDFDNSTIREFNRKLKEYACSNEHYYLDIYSAVADEDGYLQDEYCSDPEDMGMHFNFTADKVWEDYLLAHPDGN